MPVIECTCGMVMSVPARGPRVCCIRCGRAEFHLLEPYEDHPRAEPAVFAPRSKGRPNPALSLLGAAFAAPIGSVAVT